MKKLAYLFSILGVALLMCACSDNQSARERISELDEPDSLATNLIRIPYQPSGLHEIVTVAFNGVPMNLMWDTGCSITTIPLTEFERMIKEDKITGDDLKGVLKSRIADGTIVESFSFNIGTVTFNTISGAPKELHDVIIQVSPNPNASSLLGKNIIDELGHCRRNESESCFVLEK